ncbi:MAG: DUF4911 domain-containing protein [Bacteriovoracaceae bacterium]|nr:DUF4911 domain-containing protein [Bacteriovoracaceae bacterium]
MNTYLENKKLNYYVLEMPKEDSSFFYFTLESNEGICFYSTLDFEKGEKTRKVEVHVPPEWNHSFLSLLEHLSKTISFKIL